MRNTLSSTIRVATTLSLLALTAALPLGAAAAISEDFDGVTAPALPSGWTSTVTTGSGIEIPWTSVDVDYANSAPNAVWIDDYDDYADISLVSPTYAVPAATTATITFEHSYTLWAPGSGDLANGVYNGGVLEVSIDGGAFTDFVTAGGVFTTGGYDQTLDPTFDNPIAQTAPFDRPVWGDSSGAFIETSATLPLAAAGGTVALRWRLGTEGGGRSIDTHSGWWVDNFTCDQCTAAVSDVIFANGFESP